MDYTFEDYLDDFLTLKRRKHFSASVQSTYFAILAEFHLRQFPKQISMTGRELAAQAGLRSVSSIHEAKNVLKNNRLIDFYNKDGLTIIELCCRTQDEQLPNTNRTQAEHEPNSNFGKSCVSCAQNAGAITNTRDDGDEDAAPLSPSPAPLSSIPQTTEAINPNQAPAGSASKAEDEIAIEDIWEQMVGRRLERAQECNELRALEKAHGREIIKVAIAEHVRCNGRSFNYFKACLQTALKKKGGDKNGRVAQRPVNNRPNVLAFTAGRTTGDFGDTQTSGKGRFDDDEEPDYSWLYDGSASVAAGDRGD